jgi:hypothetical protein
MNVASITVNAISHGFVERVLESFAVADARLPGGALLEAAWGRTGAVVVSVFAKRVISD